MSCSKSFPRWRADGGRCFRGESEDVSSAMSVDSVSENAQEYPKSLACADCKQTGSRQTLAALSRRDWQGTLLCICESCYNARQSAGLSVSSGEGAASGRDFAAFHRKSWRARKTRAKGFLRVKGWQQAQQQLSVRGDTESRAEYRRRIVARALILAAVCSVRRMDPVQRSEVAAALDWWVAQQEEIAREPSHVPSLTTPSAVLPECAAQYLSSITDTLSEYFLCRHYDTHVLSSVALARSLGTIFFSMRVCGRREATVSFAVVSC